MERWRPSRGLGRRGPFGDFFERDMSDLFGRAFRSWPVAGADLETPVWGPPVDLVEKEGDLILRVDLPGVKQKNVHLSVQEGMLTIRGSREEKKEERDETHFTSERWSGTFSRSLALPRGIDTDKVTAVFTDGVLEVRIPRTAESSGRTIEVQSR